MDLLIDYFLGLGLSNILSLILTSVILALVLILISIFLKLIVDKIVLNLITHHIKTNRVKWDDFFLERGVFKRASHLIVALIIYFYSDLFPFYADLIKRGVYIYIILIIVWVLDGILDAINDVYNTTKNAKTKPIKGFLQVVKIILAIIAGIIIISNLIGQNPLVILSGLGAISAVLLLIFKDSILGFVAGITISTNDMVRIGDWIEMPKYNADGDVIDISLNTIKVENFDKTITTIPTYALVSDSFKNWRGMQQSGGRRIKRAIFIDVDSVCFLSNEMLMKLKKVDILKEYILSKEKEISKYNKMHKANTSIVINGRRLTNIGTFRAYLEYYLNREDRINKDMIKMVRQLSPTKHGVPLEIYAFTNDTNWIVYEKTQSDIFDHIFAVAKEFGLRIFQEPTGNDMREGLSKKTKK